MLLINIEVAGGISTKRIVQVAIRNEGPLGDLTAYSVWVDGKSLGEVVHEPEDGAVRLVSLALELVQEKTSLSGNEMSLSDVDF